jgi:hypothetical protein
MILCFPCWFTDTIADGIGKELMNYSRAVVLFLPGKEISMTLTVARLLVLIVEDEILLRMNASR